MNKNVVWISLVYLWCFTNAYYIKDIVVTPPKAKFGFNSQFLQQDESVTGILLVKIDSLI